MSIPAYVNSGTRVGTGFGTSVTPGLPASRVNGNLMIMVSFNGLAIKTHTTDASWTALHVYQTKFTQYIWYRFVDGTETAPTVSWTGSTSGHAYIHQFSGNLGSAQCFGNSLFSFNTSTNTTITNAGCNTSAPNSLGLALINDTNHTFTGAEVPSGYTSLFVAGNDETCSIDRPTGGSAIPAISASAPPSNAFWACLVVEIRSSLPFENVHLGAPILG